MPRDITVTFADGTMHLYQGAPDEVTPEQVQARAQQDFGKSVTGLDGGRGAAGADQGSRARAAQQSSGILGKAIANLIPGAIRGAGSIGATLLYPVDKITDLVQGDRNPTLSGLVTGQQPLSRNEERRAGIDAGLQSLGADPNDPGYKLGRLGGEVAGTLGVGGALASTVGRIAPAVAAAIPNGMNALRTGGMVAGPSAPGIAGVATNALTRAAGGAITGGASAGLVDPEQAKTGAVVGAILPPGLQAAGAFGRALAAGWRSVSTPSAAAAEDLAQALGVLTPGERAEAVRRLRDAQTLVPGSTPTVAQAMLTPDASITQRVVYDSPGGVALRNKIAQQGEARTNALEGVAPTNVGGVAQARNDFGTSVQNQMLPEEARLAAQVRGMYNGVDPQGTVRLGIPLGDFAASSDRYLGAGSFGQGSKAKQAIDEAAAIGLQRGPDTTRTVLAPTTSGAAKRLPQQVTVPGSMQEAPATWDEVRRLRSSINDAWQEAKDKGRSQESAALNEMRRSLDSRIDAAAAGAGQPGDVMPQVAADAYREANRSYAALQGRFHTGPQAGLFRKGGDGLPVKQGGEIASAFWGNRPGLAEDVQSFRRLVDDQPGLMGQFRSLITTHGAGTADAAGNLTTKFSKWVEQTLPGLRGAFSPDEVQTLQRIAADIDRAATAQKLGTSLGGSNTYQNAANALNLGLLDSPMLTKAAGMVPGVRMVAGPALEGARSAARNAKATRLADLLSDSQRAANALEAMPGRQQGRTNPLAAMALQGLLRAGPVAAADR